MNTSATKFTRLITEHPTAAPALRRLQGVLEADEGAADRVREFPVARIVDIVAPVTHADLVNVLDLLVSAGILTRVLRVESPASGGIADFDSIMSIPPAILDIRTDSMLQVTPDRIKVIYRTH